MANVNRDSRQTQSSSENKDLIDKEISFESREMHKKWPMIKGCLTLAAAVAGFIFLSLYLFRNFKQYFG